MRSFSDHNPAAVFLYFCASAGTAMFTMNPVMLLLSLCGALCFSVILGGAKARTHISLFLLLILFSLINPIFNHNGVTVLFILNDNPVTLEALLYGTAASCMIISVLYWFKSFSRIMTSDKLLYLFSAVSPKLALMLSLTLRYIPLFSREASKVNMAQKALGLYKEDNIIDSIRGGSRVLSVMVTWALENGIITADSMAARGYGVSRRTSFSVYRFRRSDALLLIITLLLFGVIIASFACGALRFDYYPAIDSLSPTPLALCAYISYGILVFLPSFYEVLEGIRWKYLLSRS